MTPDAWRYDPQEKESRGIHPMLKIAFRVDAGGPIGLGHVYRCIALADELRHRGHLCWFWSNEYAGALALRAGHTTADLAYYPKKVDADVWVVDLQKGCPPYLGIELRELAQVFVLFNGVGYANGDPSRLLADLVVYQGFCRRPYEMDWTAARGQWHEGADWIVLRRSLLELRRERALCPTPAQHILVYGGANGTATVDLITRALRVHHVRTLVGSEKPDRETWAWANVTVLAYGMTALEALALGLPVVAISATPEHLEGAMLAEKHGDGALVSLGLLEDVEERHVRNAVDDILLDLPGFSRKALAAVDGQGVVRVADEIERFEHDKESGNNW